VKKRYLSSILILAFIFSMLYISVSCRIEEPGTVEEKEEEKIPPTIEGELETFYLPEKYNEDSIIAEDNQGVVGPKSTLAVGNAPGNRLFFYSFVSWDITSLDGIKIEDAELIFNSSMIDGDPFSFGPIQVMVVDWGEKYLMPEDTYTEGELIATSDEADFVIDSEKLKDEIQKAIDSGKSRFQIKMYMDYPDENSGKYIGIINYKLGQIKLKVSARGVEDVSRNERPSHQYISDGITGVSYLYRDFLQTPQDIAYGPDGYLYIADGYGKHIVTISPEGEIDDMGIWKDPNIWQTFWNHEYETWAPYDLWNNACPRSLDFNSLGQLYISSNNTFILNEDSSLEIIPNMDGTEIISFGPNDELYYTMYGAHLEGEGKIFKIDSSGERVLVVDGLTSPRGLAVSLDGTIYTCNLRDERYYDAVKFEPGASEFSEFYPAGGNTVEVFPRAVDSDGDIWISGWINGGFHVFQLSPEGEEKPYYIDGKLGSEYHFSMGAQGIAFSEDGRMAWVSEVPEIWELVPTGKGEDDFTLNVIHEGIYCGFSLEASPDGNVYTFEGRSSSELLCFSQDGKYEIILDCKEEDLPDMRHVVVDSKGTIYINFSGGEISILEPDGSLTHYASLEAAQMTCGFNDNIYVLIEGSIVCIDGIDSYKTIIRNINGIKDCSLEEIRIAASPDGGIFVYNQRTAGLYYITPEGKEEFFINLDYCNLGTGGFIHPWEITVTQDGEIYAESWDLYRIDKNKNVYLHAFGATDNNAIEVSPDGKWLYMNEWGAISMIPIDAESKKHDRLIYKGFPFYPNLIWEEGYSIVTGGSDEGVYESEVLKAYVNPDGSSAKSIYSFDIEGIKGKDIEYAELILNTSKVSGDIFSYGPLCIAAVDWGDRGLVLDDFYIEGELIEKVYEHNFKINNDKLKEEIQKAVDAGKSRFKIMLYIDIGDKEVSEQIGASYCNMVGRKIVIYTKQR